MIDKTTELIVVSNKNLQSAANVDFYHHDISSALQTTLEFEELIAIFCTKIQQMIPHKGIEYHNPEFDLNFKRGVSAAYSCRYALQVEDQQLGELILLREHSFSGKELQILARLLCCLIYPLRNATLFHQALKMAYTDTLTKTSNRAAFYDCLQREIKRVKRSVQPLSLVFVDLDDFKAINDTYGHECGDMVLAAVANWLTVSVRGSDAVFRYGGEEFVVILCDTDADGARVIAERIRKDIAAHTMAYDRHLLSITASVGVSTLMAQEHADSLVKRADAAMYRAKKLGRNQVCVG